MYFFSGLAKNEASRRDMYKFVQKNLEDLLVRFKGNFSIGRLIQYSFDRFTTEADRQSVIEFYKDKESVVIPLFASFNPDFSGLLTFCFLPLWLCCVVLPFINPHSPKVSIPLRVKHPGSVAIKTISLTGSSLSSSCSLSHLPSRSASNFFSFLIVPFPSQNTHTHALLIRNALIATSTHRDLFFLFACVV